MNKARGKIHIEIENCKGCGLCIEACPTHILALDKENINIKGYHPLKVVEPEKCIGCANCAVMCPDSVITVKRK